MKPYGTRDLAKGQVCKMRFADIEVVELGRDLVHYRVTNQLGRKRVSAQISGIPAMQNYLTANAARLVKGASNN